MQLVRNVLSTYLYNNNFITTPSKLFDRITHCTFLVLSQIFVFELVLKLVCIGNIRYIPQYCLFYYCKDKRYFNTFSQELDLG